MNICHMRPDQEPAVRTVFRAAHRGWPEPASYAFLAYPTLVALTPGGVVAAYAQYWMNLTDAGAQTVWLRDTGVHPFFQGQGLGARLMDERICIGRSLGAKVAVGVTQVDNEAMLSILTKQGFERTTELPAYYPQFTPAKDGVLFLKTFGG